MNDDIYFSIAEREILTWMTDIMGVPYLDAVNHVLAQKRELAYIHGMRGNIALRRQILKEIKEWTDEHEQDYQRMLETESKLEHHTERKIYIPG